MLNSSFNKMALGLQTATCTLIATCFAPSKFAPVNSLYTFYTQFAFIFNGLKNEK